MATLCQALELSDLELIHSILAPADRRLHHFALLVDNMFAARADLESKGFTNFMSHDPRPDGVIQLFFRDPGGYRVELLQPLSGKTPEKVTGSTS